jgi:hypothetical protein
LSPVKNTTQNKNKYLYLGEKFMKAKMLLSILGITLALLFCQNQASATPDKVKGMFLNSTTLSSVGTSAVIDTLYANDIETVYLFVKTSTGVLTDSTLLADFITAAHSKGIEVFFWYSVSQDAVFMGSNPDAVIYHSPKPGTNNSDPYPMSNDATARLNYLYPGYKDYVVNKIKLLVQNYNLDGIHLDNIRYHHMVYSFDKYHLAKAVEAGIDTAYILNLWRNDYTNISSTGWINLYVGGDTNVVKWVNMRKDVIYDYINSIKTAVKQIKPNIEVSASFTPEINNDAMTHYSQDYTLCAPVLDRVIPTAFFLDYGQGASWIQSVTEQAVALVAGKCKVTTGCQISNKVTDAQLTMSLNGAVEGGSHGIVLSRFGVISEAQYAIIKAFYLATLPVELTSFTANTNLNSVNLMWSTATEKNNLGFEVQRKTARSEYQAIGFINAQGTTTEAQNYSYTDKDLQNGAYTYRLKQIDYDGTFAYSQEVEADLSTIKSFSLEQNYPNPFNPATTIKFSLPAQSTVTLKVFNVLGENVVTLLNNVTKEAGAYSINFDASNLPSGIYMYSIQAGNNIQNKKMLLMK